jgi:hypothetical protein
MGAKQLLWGIRRQTGQRGIIWGMSLTTGLLEIRDLWTEDHPNLSALLCGKPGSGKTTAQLTLLKRMAVAGCRVIYVDPIGKGRLLADACAPGSAYYDVHADGIINPLDVVAADFDGQAAAVRRKLSLILGLTDMEVDANTLDTRRFTLLEEAAIDLALQQLYGADLQVFRTGSRPAPTLPDLVAAVAAVVDREQLREAQALARDLQYFVRMRRAHRFIGQTTVAWDFRPDVVAYSFAHVPKDLRPLYYTIVFEAIDDYVRSRPQWPPVIACIDELRYMAQVAGLMDFVRHATRTWRNKGAGLWAADQNPGTWFGDGMAGAGQMTANNTRLKWFGQLDPDDIRIVMERFGDVLTADDQVALRLAGRGDAVLIFDTEPVRLHLGLTDRETEYFVRRARDDQDGHADDAE